MDSNDLQGKYLMVGHRGRADPQSDKTLKGRQVMGGKGIGKLTVLSIALHVLH